MSKRLEKVNELIKGQVAMLIPREVTDPELGLVTVTAVITTADLHYATIWISVLGKNPENSLALIEKAARRIQKILNDRLRMKYVPKISFKLDEGEKDAGRIEELIQELHRGKK